MTPAQQPIDFWSDPRFWKPIPSGLQRDVNQLEPVDSFDHDGLQIDDRGRYLLMRDGARDVVSTAEAADHLEVGDTHLRFWVVKFQRRISHNPMTPQPTSGRVPPGVPAPTAKPTSPHITELPGWWHGD